MLTDTYYHEYHEISQNNYFYIPLSAVARLSPLRRGDGGERR